jgi:hypothetical protein
VNRSGTFLPGAARLATTAFHAMRELRDRSGFSRLLFGLVRWCPALG